MDLTDIQHILREGASHLSSALLGGSTKEEEGTGDVLQERAKILGKIKGRTLGHVLLDTAEKYGRDPALTSRQADGGWETLTWSQVRDQVLTIGAGLASLGVKRGDFVAIMAANRPEHILSILGVIHSAATPSTFYNTLAPEQIQYAADHCGARVAILDRRDLLERWLEVRHRLPGLEQIVLIGDDAGGVESDAIEGLGLLSWTDLLQRGRDARQEYESRWQEVEPEDPVTLIYTSGTTGPPKGVVVSHRSALWTTESVALFLERETGLDRDDPDIRKEGGGFVSYLPLAHIAEQLISIHIALHYAGEAYCCPELTEVFDYVRHARPISFFAVPRLWEKLKAGIAAKGAEEPSRLKRWIGRTAVQTGLEVVRRQQRGQELPLSLRLRHGLAERIVLSKIREALGLDRSLMCSSSSAPLPVDVGEFFAAIGLPLTEAWGMTETTGVATFSPVGRPRIGSVGRPLPGVEVKLADDGELLVRGPHCISGYLKMPEASAELIDEDGWLHTGDIGARDPDGFYRVIDRKKELLITSSGKNISPAVIEAYLKEHPLIGEALAYGDGKHYVVALLTLAPDAASAWAEENSLAADITLDELARHPLVLAATDEGVKAANARLSRIEQIKKFHLLPVDWPVGGEELTPTMKLKRRVIHEKYRDQIAVLYDE